jgi:RNA polymerase sigma-70 factor, ECF subfamily
VSQHPGFRDLYEREFGRVVRAVYLLVGDRTLAEDAAQEAFARALARWRRIGSHPAPAGWVTTTALNVARRQLRRQPEPPRPLEEGGRDEEERLSLLVVIRALPPRQQEAVVLHYLVDLPVAEVAAAMEVDEGTVKTHLFRARAAIAVALADPIVDPTEELTS